MTICEHGAGTRGLRAREVRDTTVLFGCDDCELEREVPRCRANRKGTDERCRAATRNGSGKCIMHLHQRAAYD